MDFFPQNNVKIDIIAHVRSDFPSKFAVPRQSGMHDLSSYIVFEPQFRREGALKGLEEFSHLWVLWLFSEEWGKPWSPTVRPPKLGGNVRKGVFASRSPFRPNPIGLSAVGIQRVFRGPDGPVIEIKGADIKDGTPVIDIKPYVPYSDCLPGAKDGFSCSERESLNVVIDDTLLQSVPEKKRGGFLQILALDPRPAYQHDPARVYKFEFAGLSVSFRADDKTLTVLSIESSDK